MDLTADLYAFFRADFVQPDLLGSHKEIRQKQAVDLGLALRLILLLWYNWLFFSRRAASGFFARRVEMRRRRMREIEGKATNRQSRDSLPHRRSGRLGGRTGAF
jgi:hypothetical protein